MLLAISLPRSPVLCLASVGCRSALRLALRSCNPFPGFATAVFVLILNLQIVKILDVTLRLDTALALDTERRSLANLRPLLHDPRLLFEGPVELWRRAGGGSVRDGDDATASLKSSRHREPGSV